VLSASLRAACALRRGAPADEHSSPEQDESGNDGHRDRYAGKPRAEAHAFTTNITHGHGGL